MAAFTALFCKLTQTIASCNSNIKSKHLVDAPEDGNPVIGPNLNRNLRQFPGISLG